MIEGWASVRECNAKPRRPASQIHWLLPAWVRSQRREILRVRSELSHALRTERERPREVPFQDVFESARSSASRASTAFAQSATSSRGS